MSGLAFRRGLAASVSIIALSTGCAPTPRANDASTRSAVDHGRAGIAEPQPADGTPAPAQPSTSTATPAVGTAPSAAPATAAQLAETQPEEPTGGHEAAKPSESAQGSADGEPSHDPHRFRRVVGWIGLTLGAEAAVVAITTSFMLEHQKRVLDDGCDAQKQCSAAGLGASGAIHETVPWNTAAFIVAAAGLGGGTLLLLTSRRPDDTTTAVTVTPSAGGMSLGLKSTF